MTLYHTALTAFGALAFIIVCVVISLVRQDRRYAKQDEMYSTLRREGRLQEWTNLP